MPKKKTAKPKRPPKPHGHSCRVCGRRRPNEKFSGKGHAAHICRECANEKRADRKREREIQAFGPKYLANRKRIAVELNYDNWRFYPWKEAFGESAFEMQFDDDGIYDVDWGIDKYGLYSSDDAEIMDENSFNGDWNALVEASVGADRGILRQHRSYLETARILAESLAPFPEVRKIILFGDFAKPPSREANLKRSEQPGPFRLPNDLDLAIWLSSMENLHHMRRLRAKIVADRSSKKTKLSEERIRLHIFENEASEYLGRLCTQGRCPGNNPSCQGEGCGKPAFVKPFSDLALDPDAFAKENCQILFERRPREPITKND